MAFPKPQTLEEAVLTNSIQSRATYQRGYDVPIGGYDPLAADAGLLFNISTQIDKVPMWSIYPASRDRVLRHFWKTEPIIAGAIYSIVARLKALSYELVGKENLHDSLHVIFESSDMGAGLRVLISKTINDIITQDNGAFWELIGAGEPDGELLGDVVMGVNYLDPAQCYRTFDPEFPVMYINPINGTRNRLHKSRVVMMSNMPQPNELARNVGVSHLSRVLLSTQLMYSIQQYRREKASGTFTRAIGYGTGMTSATLRKLIQSTEYENEAHGLVRFGKIPFFTAAQGDVKLNILDLASIPDGFDLMKETEVYVNTVALCFGVDTRELWPATQTGATKADASIQAMKARGKGLADLITLIEDTINERIMPEGVEFVFDFIDDAHDKGVSEQRVRVTNYLTQIKNAGGIDDTQYQAMLIHENVLDPVILEENESPEEEINEEPESEVLEELEEEIIEDEESEELQAASMKHLSLDAFAGISFANNTQLIKIQRILKALIDSDDVRWEIPPTFHITLVYSPEMKEQQLQEVINNFSFTEFTVESQSFGIFENDDERALHLVIEPNTKLEELQSKLYKLFNKERVELSQFSKPFNYNPHITLAYLPKDVDIPNAAIADFNSIANTIIFTRDDYDPFAIVQGTSFKSLSIAKTQAAYTVGLVQVSRDFWEGRISFVGLVAGMDAVVRRFVGEAYIDGAAEGGLRAGDFLPNELTQINTDITNEQSHVNSFADYISSLRDNDADFDIVLSRLDMWANRYVLFVNKGLALAESDKKKQWRRGPTEKGCIDCINMDERVYRMSTLTKWEVLPRTWELTCRGLKCQCDLFDTDEPITRGRPPSIGKGR